MQQRIPGIDRSGFHIDVEDGCEISETCFACPLPLCIEDIPIGSQIMLAKAARVKSYWESGFQYREIAVELNISTHVVKHLLKLARSDGSEETMETYSINAYLQEKAFSK